MVKKLGEEEEPTKEMRKQPVRQEENQKGVVPKKPSEKMVAKTKIYPILPLRDIVVYPKMIVPLFAISKHLFCLFYHAAPVNARYRNQPSPRGEGVSKADG